MFNPFTEKPKAKEKTIRSWEKVYKKPYDKNSVDPYTKARIILMNGIEVEAVMFGHNFHRNCPDNELRREAAFVRRSEQQQQKTINWLSPGDETQLETTIGYEHLAVDLTAWLADHEPDKYVKQCMDFALLEDFDHLYRYANLLEMKEDIPAHKLVKDYVEITPGRPTISHYRHPYESVKKPCDFTKAATQTKLGAMILTAGEQQTMNYYMNIGNTRPDDLGRELYLQIGMVEEQHVTHYGALLDPNCTWLENMFLREFMECYLYYSFYTDEKDPEIKQIWEEHLEDEVCHFHAVAKLLQKYEKKDPTEVCDGKFPELLHFKPMKEYVRNILKTQVELTADKEDFQNVNKLDDKHEFFSYQKQVNNKLTSVASHVVIQQYQKKNQEDYRYEDRQNPLPELQDRTKDNTTLGREKTKELARA